MLAKLNAGAVSLEAWPDFEIVTEGPNTEEEPFLLEEIGVDFFLRVQLKTRKVIWFESPAGEVYHSAAKPGGAGGRAKPGKRYCHICHKCFSANNFQTQHLANLHRPTAPSDLTCVPDGAGGVHLWWKPPPPPPCGEPELAAFQLRFSIDGGVSWQVGIENTDSPEPCARVGNLSPGHAYLFMVAAINAAGMGDFSPPSPPLHHSPDGITTAVPSLNSILSSPHSSAVSSPHGSPPHGSPARGAPLPPSMVAGSPKGPTPRGSPALAAAPAPAPAPSPSDVIDAFVETMSAEATTVGDDDLALTLQSLLGGDELLESPRVEAIRRRRDSMDAGFAVPLSKRSRVEAAPMPAPPTAKRSSFSFDLEAADLELLLGDALPDINAGPLYRKAGASPGVLGVLGATGSMKALLAEMQAGGDKEKLKGSLSRSSSASAAGLVKPKTIYQLKAKGFDRTASRLLSHATRSGPFDATELPTDQHSAALQEEAKLLAAAAPPPLPPAAAAKPPPKLVALPSPRPSRSSWLFGFALLALLASLAVGKWMAVPQQSGAVQCSFGLQGCAAAADGPRGDCAVTWSPLPQCVPKQ